MSEPKESIESNSPRAETGPMKFGHDWTGVFIRGDDAFGYASSLNAVLKALPPGTDSVNLQGLKDLLLSAVEDGPAPPDLQHLPSYGFCEDS